ncbi:MAG: 4-hydroxy-2-oxoglutarate aldolase, mitochondrial [Cirrosporium novae-zelandiae]|nr:MAG: 4-hydroxy-2-oxoglutarate aldolase, mitochondrial [Cirrosporium novae-zelandiae]
MASLDGYTDTVNGDYPSRPLVPGFYVPTVAFFEAGSEDLDVSTTEEHVIRLAQTGISGIVTHGSNGEAAHLSHDERMTITRVTREALDSVNHFSMPVIVGCGAQSTRETIQLCKEAYQSGGSYALVLPASYYGSLLTSHLVLDHFRTVADTSPIPILIYNFPSASGGLDLNSDQILALSEHPNIVGVKLTCGNTGKLARIAAGAPQGFLTFGGSADFTLPTLIAGGHGIIGGIGNVAPKACIQVMDLYNKGQLPEAQKLQAIVARGDWVAIKGGFVAVKCALAMFYGYGGPPRKPCVFPSKLGMETTKAEFAELVELENEL